MADIPLRTYVQQLDNLIERKQVDEVIAHCRHILGLYPKHLDTYRMLGKALLEKGRHGDAADIFQRVLSVMPDDFISHVGMSIVREDEANLDAAIWHMERAFESAPANGAIQQELCRLFGRRDGVVPAKARLTRGALARMYAQGGLYLQAEAELKAALAAEADRIDLMTKLADVYWQTDQPAQAAQTSAAILQKLPYSLEANRILVNVFRAQGRANDAVVYRQRLEALDPYEAFADPAANGAGAARVDPSKVTVARLEYVAGMEDSGSPDWLASIGAKFEDPAAGRAAEAQPDWLSAAGENAPPAGDYHDYQPGQGSVPDWLKDLDSGPAADSVAQTSAPPDWLKDIGTATPQAAAQSGSNESLPDWLVSATGPLPADAVPDWMLQGSTEGGTEDDEHDTAPLTDSGLPGKPTAPFQTNADDATLAGPTAPAALPPLEPTGAVPDWLKATVADEGEEELPDWLKAITSQPLPEAKAQPAAGAPDSISAGQVSDWLHGATPDSAPTAATSPTASDRVPGWLQTAANTPPNTGPLPDWLKKATGQLDPSKVAHLLPPEPPATEPLAATAPKEQEAAAAVPPTMPEIPAAAELAPLANQTEQAAQVTSLGALPDWLAGAAIAAETLVPVAPVQAVEPPVARDATVPHGAEDGVASAAPEPVAAEALEPGIEMPDWLKAVAPAAANLNATTESLDTTGLAASASKMEGAAPMPLSGDDLPDWLQTAAAVPAQDETPVWLRMGPAAPSLLEAQADQEPELEIPDWLREIAAGAPPADSGQAPPLGEIGMTGGTQTATAEDAIGVPPVELPDYLQMASPEAIARAEQPLKMEPEEMGSEPEEEEPAAALPGEIPDWLKALAPVSPDSVLPVPQTPEPAARLEDSLSWMDELTAAALTTVVPTHEPAPEEPPAWLAAPAALATSDTAPADAADLVAGGLGEDTLAAEIPPWAQNEEPGPSDTIASWLAGKHVPDWLRQPANEAPGLPAVEWEPNQAEAVAPPEAVDSLPSTAAVPEAAATTEPPAPAEMSQAAAPDLESMDPEAAFRWLESLAAQQGANPEELFTAPAMPAPANIVETAAEPLPSPAEPLTLAAEAHSATPTAPAAAASDAASPEPGGLEEFLKQAEAAMPVKQLVDTAPSKLKPPAAEAAAPVIETPAPTALEPAGTRAEAPAAVGEAQAEQPAADFDADAAMRWLEGLAAQQGANPEELLTAPEDRTLEAPQWVAAEQAAAAQELEPTPALSASVEEAAVAEVAPAAEPVATHPTAEMVEAESVAAPVEAAVVPEEPVVLAPSAEALSPDPEAEAAMRWLEGLAAQQGANPEELLTAPEDRTLEAPAWVSESAQAAADVVQPNPTASPIEATTPAAASIADTEAEPGPAEPEPEPAAAPETPEWLRALAPAEEKLEAAPVAPAEPAAPAEAAEPPTTGAAADLDKLSRLAERLGAARRAREVEMEARFAEQRNQQEAARRWVEDRLEVKQAAPKTTGELKAAALNAAEVPVEEAAAAAPAIPEETLAAAAAPEGASRPHPRPSIRARRPHPAPEVNLPATAPAMMPAAAAEALAHGQAALTSHDYETAVAHLSVLVEQGHHLDTVVQSLEGAAETGRAPVPMLRLLGDAYMRTDQLQKALDTYRQALRRL